MKQPNRIKAAMRAGRKAYGYNLSFPSPWVTSAAVVAIAAVFFHLMNLELTDVQAEVLTCELHNIIQNDRYLLSPRIVAPRRSWGSYGRSPSVNRCPRDGIISRQAGVGIVGIGSRSGWPNNELP